MERKLIEKKSRTNSFLTFNLTRRWNRNISIIEIYRREAVFYGNILLNHPQQRTQHGEIQKRV